MLEVSSYLLKVPHRNNNNIYLAGSQTPCSANHVSTHYSTTALIIAGTPDDHTQACRCWSSHAYHLYVHPQTPHNAPVSSPWLFCLWHSFMRPVHNFWLPSHPISLSYTHFYGHALITMLIGCLGTCSCYLSHSQWARWFKPRFRNTSASMAPLSLVFIALSLTVTLVVTITVNLATTLTTHFATSRLHAEPSRKTLTQESQDAQWPGLAYQE